MPRYVIHVFFDATDLEDAYSIQEELGALLESLDGHDVKIDMMEDPDEVDQVEPVRG